MTRAMDAPATKSAFSALSLKIFLKMNQECSSKIIQIFRANAQVEINGFALTFHI